MTATTTDRNTEMKDGELISVKLAAVAVLAGTIACANASGYGVGGSTATTLTYLGRFEESVDNSAGAAGDVSVKVRRKKSFKWENHGADPVTQASLGKNCYIVDNQTVAATSGTNTRSIAGTVLGIDEDGGVWVG